MEMAPWHWTKMVLLWPTTNQILQKAWSLLSNWNIEKALNLWDFWRLSELFWGLFCQTLGYTITQLLFYTDKKFWYLFLPFYVLMVSYWAFAPLFISHSETQFYLVCTIRSVLTAYKVVMQKQASKQANPDDIPWQQTCYLLVDMTWRFVDCYEPWR